MNPSNSAETGSHLEAFLYRVPKKNHDAVVQSLKKFVPWFNEHGAKIEYYQLGDTKTMEGVESIAKTLSAAEDEEIWMELQYYRDRKHCEDTFAKMIPDKKLEPIGNEFFGLITPGKSLIEGAFSRLRE